jgi:hypothetical protein
MVFSILRARFGAEIAVVFATLDLQNRDARNAPMQRSR